ncbi:MAG: hypothetical protein II649_00135 [Kiritimatiellae bacterium]|nr:hypothetical protein [Kiritimatiellia bacterium]
MKKILYLHGFASSGASGTVALLRREYYDRRAAYARCAVVAPDIPVDAAEALPFIKGLAEKESPDLVIGTSMGAMYAQQLHGIARICINPCFALSKCYFILSVGKHKWLNKRRDGATDFHVYKETIQHFAEMEERQFDGIDDEDKTLCHGLFGDADPVARESRPVFASHYPGMDRGFEGGHRMNAELVASVLFPFIRENLPWF